MEENSFETLNYLTPGIQDPSQSEEEDLEETKGTSVPTVGLRNDVRFITKPCTKTQRHALKQLTDVMSTELTESPKNYPKAYDNST